ncbi:hypothetical protein DEJ53_06225 [Weissella confusa]|uniref:hypothetical protein n=1 Tax=Weissella confusa TaxID=1583 RepID=UPI000DCA4072|nr:hypothetical protein [Weissella confusa]RAU08132.1 hypothetical protein DEJ53_06225 [Weissella confusa]
MLFVWIGLIVLLGVIAVTIYHRYGRRLTERQIIASQQVVNAAMAVALKDLSNELLIFPMNRPTSTLVANIWGHEVMAFEFEIPYKERQEVVVVRQALNNALRAYTEDQNLVSASDTDMALVVTDVWYDNRKPMLHVDVAHVINDETAAYLRDLRKLNQPV